MSYVMGSATQRSVGKLGRARGMNMVPTAAERLALYQGNTPESLRGASNIPVYTSDFSAGADGFVSADGGFVVVAGNVDGIDGEDNWLRITRASGTGGVRARRPSTLQAGKYYSYTVRVRNETGASRFIGSRALRSGVSVPNGTTADITVSGYNVEGATDLFIGALNATFDADDSTITSGSIIYAKNISPTQIGITHDYKPSGIQLAPGQWLDDSGNGKHILIPDGGRLSEFKNTFSFQSVNTWSASSALQYLGNNQNVLHANAVITEVLAEISGTPVDGTLGDGSDADYYATAAQNVGLIAGFNFLALIRKVNDGTNRKLTWTPSGAFTGTITFTVRGYLRE